MNNMEKFCLRWNDFDTNIREYFRELLEEHSYFDVEQLPFWTTPVVQYNC